MSERMDGIDMREWLFVEVDGMLIDQKQRQKRR